MAETESTNWEENLDIDDSDLLTIVPSIPSSSSSSSSWTLRPCSSSSHSRSTTTNPRSVSVSVSPRVIPGPAGAVQAVMQRIRYREVGDKGSQWEGNGGGVVNGLMDLDDDEVDVDFQLHSWIYAMQYLGRESNSVSPIASIRTRTTGRVPMVVGLVKSCTSNGLGDLSLTLKDQTGTINASIHHKSLLQGTLGSDISVGCVLILKQVVVFSPARSIHCLNITKDNVVKLIGKNCGPPQEQLTFSFATELQDNGKEKNKQMEQPLINNGLENHVQIRESAVKETRSERVASCGIISRLNPKENEVLRNGTSNIPNQLRTRAVEPVRDSQDILRKISGDTLFNKISNKDTSVKILKENPKRNLENNENENPVSKVPIPEWTDEQLSELFADY